MPHHDQQDNPYTAMPLSVYRMKCGNCLTYHYMFDGDGECPICGEEMQAIENVDMRIYLNSATGDAYVI